MSRRRQYKAVFFVTLVCALTALGCLFLYMTDNKYTAKGPQPMKGLLLLDKNILTEYPILFLTEGWEYYSRQLLTPDDFVGDAPIPDAYIYIGQFGGFEAGGLTNSPHGSASYRLRIRLPEESQTYLLELPEIFSAYRLYVNGIEAAGMGDPDPVHYRAETGNRTVSLEAGGEVELLFAVSDFSHLYSGMVYPPAFGEPYAVSRLLNTRLIVRGLITAFALAIGLLSALTGILSGRNRLAVLYGLLCLCFVGFSSYPLLRTLISSHPALYAIENFSFCAMLLVVMLLQKTLHDGKTKWSRYFIGLGGAICLFSALLPLLLPSGSYGVMAAYSIAVSAYELLTAGFITVTAILALRRGLPYSAALLCGFLILDVALVMDRLLPLFEPIVGGWFYELSSFGLVICIGGAVGQELAAKYRESAVLTERQVGMERLAQMQRASYELLLEKVEETKAVRHDLRHHFTVMDGLLQSREYERLGEYVAQYQAAVRPDELAGYTQNVVADVLLRHYAKIAGEQGIDFAVHARLSRDSSVADSDLCAVLANLLENAVEACGRMTDSQRFISISMTQSKAALSIQVENSAERSSVRQKGNSFASVKAEERIGYGLSSVSATVKRYGGEAEFIFDDSREVFTSTILLAPADSTSL